MFRIGIVDFDTSHVVEFTKRINHVDVAEEQWIEGARVIMGCPGASKVSPERIAGYAETLSKYGVQLVDQPEEMIGKIDAVLVESNGGQEHLRRVKPFLEAKIPAFVDKPFACSLNDALIMFDLAAEKEVPLLSTSSLRYGLEVLEIKEKELEYGPVIGADCYSPAAFHPENPGLFHYGIHGVDTLFALMGTGCEYVQNIEDEGTTFVTGYWKDGRLGTMRGTRKGGHNYGFTAFCDQQVVQRFINTGTIYFELLKRIVRMFQTGTAPVAPRETLEVVAFIEAAMQSAEQEGRRVAIKI